MANTFTIEGRGVHPNFSGPADVRLRGNSTFSAPKKSFKVRLRDAASLVDLPKEKDWVLLANWLDFTLMCNAIAMKAGHLLQMPFTNHVIPVELTVNGTYQGSYVLTEQVEVGASRVNVGPDGQLLELDQYFDDTWKFRSSPFDLPVMVKYPVLFQASQLDPIRAAFDSVVQYIDSATFPENNYERLFDRDALVDYLIVMLLTDNEELNHPKSTFIHKSRGGKYQMGPIWDFDWAFGYEKNFVHIKIYNRPLFWNPLTQSAGTAFFDKFLKDPVVKNKLIQEWGLFKTDKLPALLIFADEYAALISASYQRDFLRWGSAQSGRNPKVDPQAMKHWLQNRADFLDGYIQNL